MEISESKEYELRKEKDVKKGLFKLGKVGRLTAETTEPRGLRLPPPRSRLVLPGPRSVSKPAFPNATLVTGANANGLKYGWPPTPLPMVDALGRIWLAVCVFPGQLQEVADEVMLNGLPE